MNCLPRQPGKVIHASYIALHATNLVLSQSYVMISTGMSICRSAKSAGTRSHRDMRLLRPYSRFLGRMVVADCSRP